MNENKKNKIIRLLLSKKKFNYRKMEYIYAVMLLNKAGQDVNEQSLKKVLESAGVTVDDAKVKSVMAALDGVDIQKVIEENSNVAVAAAPVAVGGNEPAKAQVKEEKKEEKKEDNADAAAGLGSLFG